MAATEYQYRDLGAGDSIRLLRIHRYDSAVHRVYGSLVHVDLKDITVVYYALSYTWGPSIDYAFRPGQEEPAPSTKCDLFLVSDPSFIDAKGVLVESAARAPSAATWQRLEITQSLSDLFVTHHKLLSGSYIWIDAICINQDDAAEVSRQILLMGDIYSGARKVWIWLGVDEQDLQTIQWFLREVRPRLLQAKQTMAAAGLSAEVFVAALAARDPFDPAYWARVFGLACPPGSTWAAQFVSFYRFFTCRRWFGRAWVLQEVVLARAATFLCGRSLVSFKELEDLDYHFAAARWNALLTLDLRALALTPVGLHVMERGELFTFESVKLSVRLAPARTRREAEAVGRESARWVDVLQRLLVQASHLKATVGKDHVYCVLGLAKRFMTPAQAAGIVVDTRDSAAKVFAWTCQLFVEGSAGTPLQFLAYVCDHAVKKTPDLPSWVVDWASTGSNLRMGSGTLFKASGGADWRREETRPRVDGLALLAVGVRVDVLRTRLGRFGGDKDADLTKLPVQGVEQLAADPDNKFLLDILMTLVRELGPLYRRDEPLESALRRTVLLDWVDVGGVEHRLPAGHCADEFYFSLTATLLYAASLREVEDFEALIRTSGSAGPIPLLGKVQSIIRDRQAGKEATTLQSLKRDQAAFLTMWSDMAQKMDQRRLFTTTGRYLGNGPRSVGPGDEVWLLVGHSFPVVLRPRPEGGFTFMGDAYVHGIMYGEFFAGDVPSLERVRIV